MEVSLKDPDVGLFECVCVTLSWPRFGKLEQTTIIPMQFWGQMKNRRYQTWSSEYINFTSSVTICTKKDLGLSCCYPGPPRMFTSSWPTRSGAFRRWDFAKQTKTRPRNTAVSSNKQSTWPQIQLILNWKLFLFSKHCQRLSDGKNHREAISVWKNFRRRKYLQMLREHTDTHTHTHRRSNWSLMHEVYPISHQ